MVCLESGNEYEKELKGRERGNRGERERERESTHPDTSSREEAMEWMCLSM